MRLLFLISILLTSNAFATTKSISCSEDSFCGISTISEKGAQKNLIENISSEIQYEFSHEVQDKKERTLYNLNTIQSAPIFNFTVKLEDNVYKAEVKRTLYLSYLNEQIDALENIVKKNNLNKYIDNKIYKKYLSYSSIYNNYSSNKRNIIGMSQDRLTVTIKAQNPSLQRYLEVLFQSKGMIISDTADIVVSAEDKSTKKVLGYGKIQYSLNYEVFVKNNKNNKEDFFSIKNDFFAKNDSDIKSTEKKYFINLIKGI